MSENSDGAEPKAQKMSAFSEQSSRRRALSLDCVKLSKTEINKIIGIHEKVSKKSTNVNSQQKHNTSKTKEGNYSEPSISSEDPEYVFKPKNSVSRTPPQTVQIKINSDVTGDLSNKRPRLESTPEMEKTLKRQCDNRSSVAENISKNVSNLGKQGEASTHAFDSSLSFENDNNPEIMPEEIRFLGFKDNNQEKDFPEEINENSKCNVELMLQNLQKAFEIIHTFSENPNSIENRFSEIAKASFSIQSEVTRLVYKVGQLEKQNYILYQKLSKCNNKNQEVKEYPDTEFLPGNMKNRKTYATVSALHINKIDNQQEPKPENQQITWSTPKITKKLETVIAIDKVSDPRNTIKQLKQEISSKDIGGGFKSVKQLKSGAIVLESHDKDQQTKLRQALKDKNHIKIKEASNTDPMFMITGIEKGLKDEEFLEELVRLNSEIKTDLGYSVIEKIKIITKKQCRNKNKENWIMQAPPSIAKWFLKQEKINFDLVKVYVREYFNLAICFKCSGFGHVAKYCEQKQCCHKCGVEHESKDCIDVLKCPNCTKMKLDPALSHHSARDRQCPVYKRKLEQYQSNINYSESDSFL